MTKKITLDGKKYIEYPGGLRLRIGRLTRQEIEEQEDRLGAPPVQMTLRRPPSKPKAEKE